jgi:hypothetical protein
MEPVANVGLLLVCRHNAFNDFFLPFYRRPCGAKIGYIGDGWHGDDYRMLFN